MVVRGGIFVAGVWAVLAGASPSSAQQAGGAAWEDYEIEARIWLDRGREPVLQNGERVRVYYRVSEDANVAIFHIDTDGTIRLVFPRSPRENHVVLGGRDYRILFPATSYWFVDEDPGMGYFFIVAAPDPLDLSAFEYSYHDGGWDLSRVGRQVYSDPYEAIDDYVAALVPDWETAAYALDFSSYHVGDSHEYPRFLCYDCHTFTPYYAWNPYYYACTSFRVVVYDDPFYYPSHRYGGGAVVLPAAGATLPRYVFKERADGEPGYPLLTTRERAAGLDGITRREPGAAMTEVGGGEPGTRIESGLDGVPDRGARALPVVVPWPGGSPGAARTRAQPLDRGPVTGREVPARGSTPTTGREVPTTQTDSPSGSLRGRPVLEPRVPDRRPSTTSNRSFWERLLPSSLFRPSRDGEARPGTARPGSATPTRGRGDARPSGNRVPTRGSVRPPSGNRPSGGSVRPPARRPSGGSSARPAPSRPPRGGSARPAKGSSSGGNSARPAPRKPSGGGSARPATPSRRRSGGGG